MTKEIKTWDGIFSLYRDRIIEMSLLKINDLNMFNIYLLLKQHSIIVERLCAAAGLKCYFQPVHPGYYISIHESYSCIVWLNDMGIRWRPGKFFLLQLTPYEKGITNISLIPDGNQIYSFTLKSFAPISSILPNWDVN